MADFARRYAWILPVAFAALLAAIGFASYRTLEANLKARIATELETTRDTSVSALQIWAQENMAVAKVHASRASVREATASLLALERQGGDLRAALLASPAQASLRARMALVTEVHGYAGWAVVSPTGIFLAAGTDRNLAGHVTGVQASIDEMAAGRTIVAPPTLVRLLDQQPVALMLLGGPVRDERGQVIAVLGFSLNPERVLGRLLVVSRTGESGETYAFNEDGILVSPSRFDEELRRVGLLPDDPDVSSYLHIHVRDPGGNVREGFEPRTPPKARPFTLAAASAVAGESGVNVDGYPDYRGVPVVGAWTWVPELGVGIATEMEVSEAYAGLALLRRQFAIIVVPLVIAALGMFL